MVGDGRSIVRRAHPRWDLRRRAQALAAAAFGLAQVLGGFTELRPGGDAPLTLFYALVWVISLHELFGASPRGGARS